MTLAGIKMRVVGRDATPMRGRGRASTRATRRTPSRSAPARASTPSSRPRPSRRPGRARTRATTRTCSTTAPTPAATTSSADGGGQRTEVHVYPAGDAAGPGLPQPAPGRPGVRAAMSGVMTMQTVHAPARPRLAGAAGLAPAGVRRRCCPRPAPGPAAAATEGTNQRSGSSARRPGPIPTFNLTTRAGYINLPDGTTAYMWGFSEGARPFQHPGPVLCVNEGDTVTVILKNAFTPTTPEEARRPCRSSSRARRTSPPTACRRSRSSAGRHADLAGPGRPARRRHRHLQLRRLHARHVPVRERRRPAGERARPARTRARRSRSGWASSGP